MHESEPKMAHALSRKRSSIDQRRAVIVNSPSAPRKTDKRNQSWGPGGSPGVMNVDRVKDRAVSTSTYRAVARRVHTGDHTSPEGVCTGIQPRSNWHQTWPERGPRARKKRYCPETISEKRHSRDAVKPRCRKNLATVATTPVYCFSGAANACVRTQGMPITNYVLTMQSELSALVD